jgi:hypothetical protein
MSAESESLMVIGGFFAVIAALAQYMSRIRRWL